MTETRCPDCGAPISPGAVVCPQCGFPLRTASPQAGGRAGGSASNARMVILGLAGVAVVMLALVGAGLAIVIPRMNAFTARMTEEQGEMALKWAYRGEDAYREERGGYTRDLDELHAPGRMDVSPVFPYALRVSTATDTELCVEAVPRRQFAGKKARALSMDANGNLYRAAGCRGESEGGFVTPGASGDAGAREMLSQVYQGIAEYRVKHDGHNPTDLSAMTTRVHYIAAMEEYSFDLPHTEGDSICVALLPNDQRAGLKAWSVNQDGKLYQSPACIGAVVETFSGNPPSGAAAHDSTDSIAGDSTE